MTEHRLDYGSFHIAWHEPTPVSRPVELHARCICGVELSAEGGSYVEAAKELERVFNFHAAGTNAP